jgi:DNA-binding PadR family transcriptional regulator
VYRLLQVLEEEGYVTATWDLSDRGPARKSYCLTDAGKECLSQWVATLDEYRRAIGSLLSQARRATASKPSNDANLPRAKKKGGSGPAL